MPPFLTLERLAKSFDSTRVLRELSLTVARGEVVALLGPSGSGKTTALRLIAGFESPDPPRGGVGPLPGRGAGTAGAKGGGAPGEPSRILVDGEDVTLLPPARRNFGMVFQHYALFPHLSVGENVAFGLESRGLAREAVRRRVAEALALVDLEGFEARRVGEISGGQQQRVALARALAPEPRVLLLDEPLSNLDPALRERTRRELRRAIRRVGITTVLVTHEQEEAFDLGDRIAVLQGGELHQVGSAEDLYLRPATRFVASFIGRSNVLPGRLEAAVGGAVAVRLGAGAAGEVAWPGVAVEELVAGEEVDLVIRPEALSLVASGSPGSLPGKVAERRYTGPLTYYVVALDEQLQYAAASSGPPPAAPPRELEVLAGPAATAPGEVVAVAPAAGGPEARIFRRTA